MYANDKLILTLESMSIECNSDVRETLLNSVISIVFYYCLINAILFHGHMVCTLLLSRVHITSKSILVSVCGAHLVNLFLSRSLGSTPKQVYI